MPSITLSNAEDKATVKRFLSSPNTRIITATVARLYVAYPDPCQWTYTGVMGAVALVQTNHSFYLRIVDLMYGRGVAWEQELYDGFVYSQDTIFFHTFQTDTSIAGFSFADEHEADVFHGKVHGRAHLRPFKPVPSARVLAKTGKGAGLQGRGKIPLNNGKLDKSRISLPSDFRHVGHIGWDPDFGFDAQNIDPAWRELFEQLDTCGVSRQQINENATFITEFVSAHGGLGTEHAIASTSNSTDTLDRSPTIGHRKSNKPMDLSRIDSPLPLRPQSPPNQRRPPPPPPPVSSSSTTAASTATPTPFHGYLPRPLAQVMASLSFRTSFYGTSTSGPQLPQSPLLPVPLESDSTRPVTVPAATSISDDVTPMVTVAAGSPPPPPPPPPPAMSSVVRGAPISIKTSGFSVASYSSNSANPQGTGPGVAKVEGGVKNTSGTPLKSAIEQSSLLTSIRESGGFKGLRKTGGLRSPPPPIDARRPVSPSAQSSQGDLVAALMAALQRRQTKMAYSDDEGEQSDDDDGWDADELI